MFFVSSEFAKNKHSNFLSKSLNLMPGLVVKHGSTAQSSLNMLFLFLQYIKYSAKNKKSVYEWFYNFINYFTPKINLIEIKKSPKSLYIPLPASNESSLQTKFLINYLKLATYNFSWRSFPKRLLVFYKNSFKKTDILNKSIDFVYTATKQNKWRALTAYKTKYKLNKKKHNVIKKSKQFYL